jgi:hypothetical protein
MNSIPRGWHEPGLTWLCRWYFLQRGGDTQVVDSLEEALTVLKSRLKHQRQNDIPGRPAPVQISGKARKRMVIELLSTPIATPLPDYDPDLNEPLPPLLECKWEPGEYVPVALIEYTPFRPEFGTRFGPPNNPVRSRVGQVCTLSAIDLDDLEEDDDDLDDLDEGDYELLDLEVDQDDLSQDNGDGTEWREIAVGTVSPEGKCLTMARL